MKRILLLLLLSFTFLQSAKAQNSVPYTDLKNQWINVGDSSRGSNGYMYYSSDSVYHKIDSFEYTHIENYFSYDRQSGYVRYDSVTGTLYGRAEGQFFGRKRIFSSSSFNPFGGDFVLMKKNVDVGDTIIFNYWFSTTTNFGFVSIYGLVVKDIKNIKPPYANYLSSFNETIDSINIYTLEYLYYGANGPVMPGNIFLEFNFISGFSSSPFGDIGLQGSSRKPEREPEMFCFWNPSYSGTNDTNCYNYMILSDNPVKYKAISIYPNPVDDYLQISGDHIDLSNQNTVIIYNATGQQVAQTILYSIHDRINTRNLSNGMYYINLIQNGSIIGSSKFVK